jgi:hypothetical protein
MYIIRGIINFLHVLMQALPGARVQTPSNATHLSLTLTVENATAEHSGTYQCRATDGNSSTHCRAGANSIRCIPTTTISTPARILIVGEMLISV